jgi:predicted flap endonuclease-1-like 5' DNA nuclease
MGATPQSLPVASDPSINDIYQDDRTEEYLRLIYIDDQITLLRSEHTRQHSDQHVHRIDDTETFNNQISHDRLKPQPDAGVDIPPADPKVADNTEDKTPESEAITGDNAQIGAFTNSGDGAKADGSADGRTPNEEPDDHSGSDGGATASESPTDDEQEDWEVVPTIGEKTAEKLHSRGHHTPEDIHAASDEELKDVPNIGATGVENLREYANE